MKGTLVYWRKMTLAGLKAEREKLAEIVKQISDLDALIGAIESVQPSKQRGPYKAKTAKDHGNYDQRHDKPKRKMTPEGLAKIRAANKKMWAARRARKKAKVTV